jgi:two-component system, NtrC family, nitrogen regulation sensor histidine kinase NtrY
MQFFNSRNILLFIGAICLMVSAYFQFTNAQSFHAPEQAERFEKLLNQRIAAIDIAYEKDVAKKCKSFIDYPSFPDKIDALFQKEGVAFFVYDNTKLLFWSDNAVPVDYETVKEFPDSILWKLKNGWYVAKRFKKDSCFVLGLALIKKEFSYHNDYLNDGFWGNDVNSLQTALSAAACESCIRINSSDKKIRSYLTINEHPPNEIISSNISIFLSIIGILFILIGIHFIIIKKRKRVIIYWLFFLLLLRSIGFYFKLPVSIYELKIFSPEEYAASDLLPTLGDLLLNSLFLLYSLFLIRNYISIPSFISNWKLFNKRLTLGVILTVLFIASYFCYSTLKGLIINSSISFDINDFVGLSISSYVCFFIFGIIFSIYFILLDFSFQVFRKLFSVENLNFVFKYSYGYIITILAVFSILGTYILNTATSERELEKRKLLAVKISAERDPIAESLFLETENKLLNDTLLKSYLRPSTLATNQVRDLAQLYFNGYWEKYSISVNVFGTDECPMTALYTASVSDPLVFDRLIDSIGIPTLSDKFFFLDNGSGRISYLARLQIKALEIDSLPLGTLYIQFQSRYTPEEIGYPELLLDKMVRTNTDLSNYSYARYTKNKLVSHYGTFPYELSDLHFQDDTKEPFKIYNRGGFSHLVHYVGNGSLVVLSLPEKGILGILTPFSYFMLFLGLFAISPFLYQFLFNKNRQYKFSFKRRIQLSIIFILFTSLLLIGIGTIFYIVSNNTKKNYHSISEKIHSLLVEIEYLFAKDNQLSTAKSDDISYALTKQANVFFADINLFDLDGQLYASSRTKIFEEGLIAKKMNPDAFYHLAIDKTTEYIHEEHIGDLSYLSAYVPMRNSDNQVIGYLNLPYFAKQNELKREIFTFVVAVINIYVLLIVLVLIAAIFLSNTVTEPLRLIQERLGNIQLGRKNEQIAWKGNDEIAELINEYNRMVSELAESAEKLARSERESAWREMAKQVAHEIKNPLTPMKLSTQLLKRAWDDKAPGFENRLERFTQALVEQIDTLSHIATEFSNFAQMPKMTNEKVDLVNLLAGESDFHAAMRENLEVRFVNELSNGPHFVYSDKEQLMRVMNNLIRNAMQAIPAEREGLILLKLSGNESEYCIEVKDNGNGIEPEIQEKIFRPNFTTKQSGMGLGLALVKSIIESSKGTISFETSEGNGSSFFVTLPHFSDSNIF